MVLIALAESTPFCSGCPDLGGEIVWGVEVGLVVGVVIGFSDRVLCNEQLPWV
jgi:hypothetical protein